METLCITCGNWSRVELHHVAGERNQKSLTVPVCIPCHRILSTWQLAAGIELVRSAEVTEEDRQRALIVGCCHLVVLMARRQPDAPWIGAEALTRWTRAFSRMLDELLPSDRPGRWLPDPSVVLPPVSEAHWVEEHRVLWFGELAHLVVGLLDAANSDARGLRPLAVSMAADPQWWVEQIQTLGRWSTGADGLVMTLVSVSAVLRQVAMLLMDPHLPSVEQQRLLDDLWASDASVTRLLLTMSQLDDMYGEGA